MTRTERTIAVLTPFVSAAAVAAGLRVGAPTDVPAALVVGAPRAESATSVAWQVFAFRDEQGSRWPMAGAALTISAREGDRTADWRGDTNADGIAEALLAVNGGAGTLLEVSAGTTILARGEARVQEPTLGEPRYAAWAPFVRRNGRIALDVAVLGQRVAPGFPATLCVRAADAATQTPMAGVEVRIDEDASLTPVGSGGVTDSAGWVALAAIPVGLAVSLTLHATKSVGFSAPTRTDPSATATLTGEWLGGLFVSPGAPRLESRARWLPGEDPDIEVDSPTVRPLAYVEIDDRRGRAWATSAPLAARGRSAPLPSLLPGTGSIAVAPAASAVVHVPRLAPGLYWAVAAGDPRGASELGPGTSVRPFFVAASDEAALAFGTDADGCVPRRTPRETAEALWPCLSLAAARPVVRWVALDGAVTQRDRAGKRRSRGVALAVGAVAVAALLELLLLLRAAQPQPQYRSVELELAGGDSRGSARFPWWTAGIALLVALLGFALLVAFVDRAS